MTNWVVFQWKTASLPSVPVVPPPHAIRHARKEEQSAVVSVLTAAFALDPEWNDVSRSMISTLPPLVAKAFETETPTCLVLSHGSRIVGASLLDCSLEAENNLLSGPAILMEYRSRGLGSALLHASLSELREHGVSLALGRTRLRGIASRFVYPKFGGVLREERNAAAA